MYCEWERSRKRACEVYSLRKTKCSVPTHIHQRLSMWLFPSFLIYVFIWYCWTCSGSCIKDFLWVLNSKRSINIDHTFCQCHDHTPWKRISLFTRLCVRFGILLKITLLWSYHFGGGGGWGVSHTTSACLPATRHVLL